MRKIWKCPEQKFQMTSIPAIKSVCVSDLPFHQEKVQVPSAYKLAAPCPPVLLSSCPPVLHLIKVSKLPTSPSLCCQSDSVLNFLELHSFMAVNRVAKK